MMADINEDQIIETVTEDGEVVQFRLFDIIEFEEKEYALLLPVEDEDSDEAELVLMRLTKEADDYFCGLSPYSAGAKWDHPLG